MPALALALLLLLLACPALAQAFSGRVVSVHDGDTLTVAMQDRQVRIHLAEIDAPELRQAFGPQARQSLAKLCLDKAAEVTVLHQERRGGTLGRVYCNGVDASIDQIRRGMAWIYKRRADSNSPLHFYQDEAQRNREGLWSDPTAAPPWAYRSNRRNKR